MQSREPMAPANDDFDADAVAGDHMLEPALRHFAKYGLSAAKVAFIEANRAFDAGDRVRADEWSRICRALDKRLAQGLAQSSAQASRHTF